jgi:transposase
VPNGSGASPSFSYLRNGRGSLRPHVRGLCRRWQPTKLYKGRWQVELFFKWIKLHLRIKKFYGTSENAVKSQIWIAVSD